MFGIGLSRKIVLLCPDWPTSFVDSLCGSNAMSRLITRSNPMKTSTTPHSHLRVAQKSVPDGFHTVTPDLVCAGASDAIAFYKRAFRRHRIDATAHSRW